MELDSDLLKPVTLWKLYDFTQRTAQTASGVVDESDASEPDPMTRRSGLAACSVVAGTSCCLRLSL